MRLLLWTLLLLLSLPAFALDKPGCCKVCWGEQACGNDCISKNEVCSIPLGWGCACDEDFVLQKFANKAKCCKHQGGVCGCAGNRILCCNIQLSDKCGCNFILEGEGEEGAVVRSRY